PGLSGRFAQGLFSKNGARSAARTRRCALDDRPPGANRVLRVWRQNKKKEVLQLRRCLGTSSHMQIEENAECRICPGSNVRISFTAIPWDFWLKHKKSGWNGSLTRETGVDSTARSFSAWSHRTSWQRTVFSGGR